MVQTPMRLFAPNTLPRAMVPATITAAVVLPMNCLRVSFIISLGWD